jgi:hypothetical protein
MDMPRFLSVSESKLVLREIASHLVAGSACFVMIVIAALATDYAGLGRLLLSMPEYSVIALLGAAITFAPLVFAIAIGSVRRGEQAVTRPELCDD